MEGRPADTPLKVCPHCSVASRTDAGECPSCGKPYGTRGWTSRWSWWFAIPIVVAAFLVGLLVIGPLIAGDDSESEVAITLEQGAAVPEGISQAELESRLDASPALVEPRRGRPQTTCAYYPIEGEPGAVWEFCFRDDELFGSTPISE